MCPVPLQEPCDTPVVWEPHAAPALRESSAAPGAQRRPASRSPLLLWEPKATPVLWGAPCLPCALGPVCHPRALGVCCRSRNPASPLCSGSPMPLCEPRGAPVRWDPRATLGSPHHLDTAGASATPSQHGSRSRGNSESNGSGRYSSREPWQPRCRKSPMPLWEPRAAGALQESGAVP